LHDQKTIPPLVDNPGIATAIRSGNLIAPKAQPWMEAYEETLHQGRHPVMLEAAE
jgi:hypothetical protein